MDEQKKNDEVEALRQKLREEREIARDRPIGTPDTNTQSDRTNDDRTDGTTFQDARRAFRTPWRNNPEFKANDGSTFHDERSIAKSVIRSGRPDRRSSQSDGGIASTATDATRTIVVASALEPEGPIPLRIDKPDPYFSGIKKEQKRKEKEEPPKKKPPRKPLTEAQKSEKTEELIEALASHFHSLDEYLMLRQQAIGIEPESVWSDVDVDELEAISTLCIKWASKHAALATVVDAVVESADYIEVITVLAPRINKTVEIMRKTHRPRARRMEALRANSH